jgi:hypothetical protein
MLNELLVPKSLEGFELPELLEKLTGRVGTAAVLRLSSWGVFVLYHHTFSFSGVHVFFPGEDMSVYVTTWVDDAGRELAREAVELALTRAWKNWNRRLVLCHGVLCERRTFPTASARRNRLEILVIEGE